MIVTYVYSLFSKGVPCFSNHFATKLPQLAPAAPSFSAISNQTPPSYSNLMASLNSPGAVTLIHNESKAPLMIRSPQILLKRRGPTVLFVFSLFL